MRMIYTQSDYIYNLCCFTTAIWGTMAQVKKYLTLEGGVRDAAVYVFMSMLYAYNC